MTIPAPMNRIILGSENANHSCKNVEIPFRSRIIRKSLRAGIHVAFLLKHSLFFLVKNKVAVPCFPACFRLKIQSGALITA